MEYRKLGNTGFKVSELGFGAWGIGGSAKNFLSYGNVDPKKSHRVVEYAIVNGINFFDTAPSYGDGLSEEIIGNVAKKLKIRGDLILSTKSEFKRLVSPYELIKKLKESLDRLKTDYIDLYQLHSPDVNELIHNTEILTTLDKLQKEGLIRKIGVSVQNPGDIKILANSLPFDVYQVNFNLLDQRIIEHSIYDFCIKNQFGLIARTPLFFGFLTGATNNKSRFEKNDHRSRWSKEQIKQWLDGSREIFTVFKDVTNGEKFLYALNFCLSYPGISTTIAGMLSVDEIKKNLKVFSLIKYNQALLNKIFDKYKLIEKSLFLQNEK